jgi:Lar family restriction alleviation protein
MTEALKPCPHCGGQAELIRPASGSRPYVMCTANFCTAPKDTEAKAIAAWNRRSALAAHEQGSGKEA